MSLESISRQLVDEAGVNGVSIISSKDGLVIVVKPETGEFTENEIFTIGNHKYILNADTLGVTRQVIEIDKIDTSNIKSVVFDDGLKHFDQEFADEIFKLIPGVIAIVMDKKGNAYWFSYDVVEQDLNLDPDFHFDLDIIMDDWDYYMEYSSANNFLGRFKPENDFVVFTNDNPIAFVSYNIANANRLLELLPDSTNIAQDGSGNVYWYNIGCNQLLTTIPSENVWTWSNAIDSTGQFIDVTNQFGYLGSYETEMKWADSNFSK